MSRILKRLNKIEKDINPLSDAKLRSFGGNAFWATLCGIATYFAIMDGFTENAWYFLLAPLTGFACVMNVKYAIKKM